MNRESIIEYSANAITENYAAYMEGLENPKPTLKESLIAIRQVILIGKCADAIGRTPTQLLGFANIVVFLYFLFNGLFLYAVSAALLWVIIGYLIGITAVVDLMNKTIRINEDMAIEKRQEMLELYTDSIDTIILEIKNRVDSNDEEQSPKED